MDHELLEEDLAHLLDGHLHFGSDVDESELDEEKHERFLYDRYDWTAAGFDPNYAVIRLGGNSPNNRRRSPFSGMYFAITSKETYTLPHVGNVSWYPLVEFWRNKNGEKVDSIKRITAHRRVGPRGASRVLYLHRVITGIAERKAPIDHRGEGSLDNRCEALHVADYRINSYTAKRKRPIHSKLLPGVEWRAGGSSHALEQSKQYVRGVIQINGVRVRSEETWSFDEQSKAHKWYLQMRDEAIKRLTPQSNWVNWEGPVPPLVFPPLKKKFYFLPKLVQSPSIETEIPF